MAHGVGRGRGRKSGKSPRGTRFSARRQGQVPVRLVGMTGDHVHPCGNVACLECYVRTKDGISAK